MGWSKRVPLFRARWAVLLFCGSCSSSASNNQLVARSVVTSEPALTVSSRSNSPSVPFEQNQGQFPAEVAFRAPSPHGVLWVTRTGRLVYDLPTPATSSSALLRNSIVETPVMRETPAQSVAFGTQPAETRVSYFLGARGTHRDIPTFSEISLGQVWPHIQVRLRYTGNQIEKVIEVAPGADPANIAFSLSGIRGLSIDRQTSELVMASSAGDVRLSAPIAYQVIDGRRHEVEVAYQIVGQNSYGFALGSYDRGAPLIIDPFLRTTYGGSTNFEEFHDVVYQPLLPVQVDNYPLFVVGHTRSTNFPGIGGGPYDMLAGGLDIVVLRYRIDLTRLLSATYIGGSADDRGYGIATGPSGVYVVGDSDSPDFPVQNTEPTQQSPFGGTDIVMALFDYDVSSLLASTYLGGSGTDEGRDIVTNGTSVFIVGRTNSTNILKAGLPQVSKSGGFDAYVYRLNSSLRALNGTYAGGPRDDRFDAVAVRGADNAGLVVAGSSNSGTFVGTGGSLFPLGQDSDSFSDCVVSTLDFSVTAIRSTFVGGAGTDVCRGITVANERGEMVVVGETDSADFPITAGVYQPTHAGETDVVAFVLSDEIDQLLASTFLGGPKSEGAYSVWANAGTLIVGGHAGGGFPGTLGGIQPNSGGGTQDGFLAVMPTDMRSLTQSTYLGGDGDDTIRAITGYGMPSLRGGVFVAGFTTSSNLPGSASGYQPGWGGGVDGFAGFISGDLLGCSSSAQCSAPTPICIGGLCAECAINSDCDDGNPCSTDTCSAGVCNHPFAPASVVCRSSSGGCDIRENCTGVSSACPVDQRRPNGFVCGAADQPCELDAVCNGLSAACPSNSLRSGNLCRMASGECDLPEVCDGTSANCPLDGFDPSGTTCATGVCNGANQCVQCITPSDCEDGNPCTINTCASGMCSQSNAMLGASCGSGLSCNGTGLCLGCTMPSQCADGNPCTSDVCNLGACSNPPAASGAPCGGGNVCEVDGAPSCVACVVDAQCGASRCHDGRFLAQGVAPYTCIECLSGTDCADGNECTADVCTAGVCSRSPLAEGTGCSGGMCNQAGVCVECVDSAACGANEPICLSGSCLPCGPQTPCVTGNCITQGAQAGRCGECNDSADCGGSTPVCDAQAFVCVPCTTPGAVCATGVCEDAAPLTGHCVECRSGGDCGGSTPYCDSVDRTCVSCTDEDVDCGGGTSCNPLTGACEVVDCTNDADCLAPAPICETATGRCIGCVDGAVACSVDQLCDPQLGTCGLNPAGDADQDGVLNGVECPELARCPDFDSDEVPDYLDNDDDDDGLTTQMECSAATCSDSDGDGSANYLDFDDDGDGLLTADEVVDANQYGADIDLDGLPAWLDTDSDGDQSRDGVEGRGPSPEGVPFYLDPDYLGGGSLSGGAINCAVGVKRDSSWLAIGLFLALFGRRIRRRQTKD